VKNRYKKAESAGQRWVDNNRDLKGGSLFFSMRKHYMICVNNSGYEASLEKRKLYEVLTDREAEKHHQVRIIDESKEDYLYPVSFFAPVRLPLTTKVKLELVTA